MDREGWKVAWIAAAGAAAVIWGGDWFADQLIPTTYPGQLAFKGADNLPPPVDLAAVQRGWPSGADGPGQRGRLMAYMQNIERQPVPRPAVAAAAGAPREAADLGTLLASADAAAGESKARVCTTCHNFEQGGPNRIGPNLWGVVGRKIASHGGFAYSPAMKSHQGSWTYERLDSFLASPAKDVPGTKMSFAGLRRPADRAAVIKYLANLGPGAPPLPQPMAAAGGSGKGAR